MILKSIKNGSDKSIKKNILGNFTRALPKPSQKRVVIWKYPYLCGDI
jgi:hypothetical protein